MKEQEEEILGYELKRVNRENKYGERVHFTLTGKKGGAYQLCENGKSVYFVQNGKGVLLGWSYVKNEK
jgi:hypothetical protein